VSLLSQISRPSNRRIHQHRLTEILIVIFLLLSTTECLLAQTKPSQSGRRTFQHANRCVFVNGLEPAVFWLDRDAGTINKSKSHFDSWKSLSHPHRRRPWTQLVESESSHLPQRVAAFAIGRDNTIYYTETEAPNILLCGRRAQSQFQPLGFTSSSRTSVKPSCRSSPNSARARFRKPCTSETGCRKPWPAKHNRATYHSYSPNTEAQSAATEE